MMSLFACSGQALQTYRVRRGHRLISLAAAALTVFGATFGLTPSAVAKPIRLVAFGDSLTAGYGLSHADGFAAKLESALRKQGHDVTVIDGGVSGDTTTGGASRLDWTLGEGTDAVILELGANDMLRGVDPTIAEANLGKMLARLQAKHIKVLLAGMRTLPSMGPDYAKAFNPIYPRLAEKYDAALYPFFMEGVVGDPAQHLPDGLHPNARGVDTIVTNILPSVDALLKRVDRKGS